PLGLRRARRIPQGGSGERELGREGHGHQSHQENDQLSDAHGRSLPDLFGDAAAFDLFYAARPGGYMRLRTAWAAMALAACGGAATLSPGQSSSCTVTLSGAMSGTYDCRPAATV